MKSSPIGSRRLSGADGDHGRERRRGMQSVIEEGLPGLDVWESTLTASTPSTG
jgi:hypothetical protein